MLSQEQRIVIVEFYFSTKSHGLVINAFQQKYPGETSLNASTITHLVQQFCDTGSIADKKRSGKRVHSENESGRCGDSFKRNSMKRLSVYINIITEFKYLLNRDEQYLG
ncbi:DUF4817 domain-containing protein [Trichonephila clavipes]|nr:DUF4817 domain-containing protein [Trichonephila clavipes]